MNAAALLRAAAQRLRAAGVPDPRNDAAQLLASVTGRPALSLRLDTDYEPTEEAAAAFEGLLLRRMDREPLQYILGTQPFLGRAFHVDGRVLIPRPETELLAEEAIRCLRAVSGAKRALDLCCGSGCLAVSMKLEVPEAEVTAADLSADALAVTALNAETLGAGLTLCRGDLWEAVGEARYDVIVSNPPYIPREDCRTLQAEVLREPMMALDGGTDGLDFYRRIAEGAPLHLLPGGTLLLEVGLGEARDVAALLIAAGLTDCRVLRDWNDVERMVTGKTSSASHSFGTFP